MYLAPSPPLPSSPPPPTARQFFTCCLVHCRAAEVMREMASLGITPGVVCYTTLLNAYGTAGDMAAAQQVLTDMIAAGVKPNSITYTSLMGYYSQLGDVTKIQASHAVSSICSLYFRPVWEVTDASLACVLQDSTAARGVPCQLTVLAAFVFSCSIAVMIFSTVFSSAFPVPHVLCPGRSCWQAQIRSMQVLMLASALACRAGWLVQEFMDHIIFCFLSCYVFLSCLDPCWPVRHLGCCAITNL